MKKGQAADPAKAPAICSECNALQNRIAAAGDFELASGEPLGLPASAL